MDSVVRTRLGDLRGSVVDGAHVFLGVPYAAPPFGANRLRPPQPAPPWSGVRDATRPGPEPPQVAPPASGGPPEAAEGHWEDVGEAFAAAKQIIDSDDSLDLNIWTPDPAASGLPVMVWVQGGMFELSSTAAYDGRQFARDGVVCVVVNWRPGAEGFLYLDDGNAAWVRFAATGDPGWPRYELTRRATMRFDVISDVVDDPRAWERALWEGVR